MNDRQLDNKVLKDTARVKKDLNTLVGDLTVQLSRFEDHVNQATGKAQENIATWVENSVSQMSSELEKMSAEARDTVADTVASVKKDVGNGLTQYNEKAQQVADKVPGGLGEKAARYPWVALTIALVSGFVLGILLKPASKAAWVAQV